LQELLLSRIELLESQLTFVTTNKKSTNGGSDEQHLRQEFQDLMEDRAKAEQIAKESLRSGLSPIFTHKKLFMQKID
jgi:hypothetical protein